MEFTAELDYAAAPDRVARMLADPEFVRRKIDATGALEATIDVADAANGAFTVTSRRSLPTDQVPASFRTFVGPTLDVRLVEAWGPADEAGRRAGTLALEIVGAPVRVNATLALVPDGAGSRERVRGTIKALVPLIGGPIEQAARTALDAAVHAEGRVGREWLAAQSTA
ncbi:conserved hypothetical protein [Beutenbergia cavernae DSM 12333]|uniref:DUF2505 domain-containing protein n=1 Tax=Beutenbergia cavernae (strain ATCC BAA-8 / DSM 12333 / CCUG 43141 / JCM 11478 / NBRC 16432 / NCIMB 13614 / HKI 0122) TaxID=471853 RepID=C5BYH5_BEUC1|nr:DUF2505 domain-containing protein [Beutenbergia cavernae]ACQ81075.1 conserved hypothetical protein [Beutenbergia cavernae DSM 12333]